MLTLMEEIQCNLTAYQKNSGKYLNFLFNKCLSSGRKLNGKLKAESCDVGSVAFQNVAEEVADTDKCTKVKANLGVQQGVYTVLAVLT